MCSTAGDVKTEQFKEEHEAEKASVIIKINPHHQQTIKTKTKQKTKKSQSKSSDIKSQKRVKYSFDKNKMFELN